MYITRPNTVHLVSHQRRLINKEQYLACALWAGVVGGRLVATGSGAKWKEQSGRRDETQGLADTGLGRGEC